MSKFRKPQYTLHKPSGQARVRFRDGAGKYVSYYLGTHGSKESWTRYYKLMEEFDRQHGEGCAPQLTIGALAYRYKLHADGYYVKNGEPTSEVKNISLAIRPLIELYRKELSRDFSPKKLKAVRDAMIANGCVRTSINRQIDRIRRMFKWAVSEELVPITVLTALQSVAGLRRGRSEAVEADPVIPVPEEDVAAIRPFVSRYIWTAIQVQLLTGARPSEVLAMRGCDIDRSHDPWAYVPLSHKTEHHGKRRTIFIGQRAQAVLAELMTDDASMPIFSPVASRDEFDAARRAVRKTPMTPSQSRRTRVPAENRKRKLRAAYDVDSYRRAIVMACNRAKVSEWSPGQLRHNFATQARREFGIEAVRVVLGHSSAVTSEIYAERDLDSARAVVSRIG